jgi:hypothetical protein
MAIYQCICEFNVTKETRITAAKNSPHHQKKSWEFFFKNNLFLSSQTPYKTPATKTIRLFNERKTDVKGLKFPLTKRSGEKRSVRIWKGKQTIEIARKILAKFLRGSCLNHATLACNEKLFI